MWQKNFLWNRSFEDHKVTEATKVSSLNTLGEIFED